MKVIFVSLLVKMNNNDNLFEFLAMAGWKPGRAHYA